jgi:hypothetical protein
VTLGPGDEQAPLDDLDDGPAVVCRACWCGPGERPRALPHWHHCDLCGERCDDEPSTLARVVALAALSADPVFRSAVRRAAAAVRGDV